MTYSKIIIIEESFTLTDQGTLAARNVKYILKETLMDVSL